MEEAIVIASPGSSGRSEGTERFRGSLKEFRRVYRSLPLSVRTRFETTDLQKSEDLELCDLVVREVTERLAAARARKRRGEPRMVRGSNQVVSRCAAEGADQ